MFTIQTASPPTFLERQGILRIRPVGVSARVSLHGIVPSPGQSVDLSAGTSAINIANENAISDWKALAKTTVSFVGRSP